MVSPKSTVVSFVALVLSLGLWWGLSQYQKSHRITQISHKSLSH